MARARRLRGSGGLTRVGRSDQDRAFVIKYTGPGTNGQYVTIAHAWTDEAIKDRAHPLLSQWHDLEDEMIDFVNSLVDVGLLNGESREEEEEEEEEAGGRGRGKPLPYHLEEEEEVKDGLIPISFDLTNGQTLKIQLAHGSVLKLEKADG